MKSKNARWVGLVFSLLLLGLTAGVWLQRQAVYDWFRLRNYDPPTAIIALADATTMNDSARRIFYVNRPSLENKEQFNTICTQQLTVTEHTNILGCYFGGQQGIFIYDIQDERLKGVEESTAAHEMLHAAYDRLSNKERSDISAILVNFFNTQVTNERIINTVETYRKADPTVVPNELHSILATEVRELNSELETYYSRYFTDRQKVVNFNEEYEALFESLKQQIAEYDEQLSELISKIKSQEQTLTAERLFIEQESARLEALEASDQIAAYNAGVPGYNQRLRQFNSAVNRFNSLVEEYQSTLEARNNAAFVHSDLYKGISSELQPL